MIQISALLIFLFILTLLKFAIQIIHQYLIFCLLFCFFTNGFSQTGFSLPEGVEKDKLSFQLINNLVVIPVEVNGTKLTFLLDTGVSSTMMFSLSEVDSLQLNNTQSVRLRGLGEGGSIPALKSNNNILKIGKAIDKNHTIYVVFDKSLNLSTRMGIPIHGIVGYDFFKNLVVKTNYNARKITLFQPDKFEAKNCNKCQKFPLIFQNKKAYLPVNIHSKSIDEKTMLLIDSGSSDAIWLFDNNVLKNDLQNKSFDDFLGLGLSGEINGKRSKLPKLSIGNFLLTQVKVAFPDEESMENIKFFEERDGSLGGEILRRFTVIMDYPSKQVILKKNNKFKDPFHYNMSGLVLKHDGVIVVKDKKSKFDEQEFEQKGASNISISTVYEYHLAPKFVVSEIRKESPAFKAGVKVGDEIVSVNGKAAYRYQLNEIIGLFASKAGKRISLKIKRKGVVSTKKFTLTEVFK